jgi:hypothetical protein
VTELSAETAGRELWYRMTEEPTVHGRILVLIAALKAERDAGVRRGFAGGWADAKCAAENAVIESPMHDPERRLLRQKIRALAPPQEGS